MECVLIILSSTWWKQFDFDEAFDYCHSFGNYLKYFFLEGDKFLLLYFALLIG